jgi:hypothetical protein
VRENTYKTRKGNAMKKERAIENTTFTMNVNGVQYTVWNGTWIEEGVCVRNDETQAYVIVKNEGTYANKSSVRKAILKHVDELSEQRVEDTADQEVMTEDEAATIAEYGAEMMMEQETGHDDEEDCEISEEEIVQTINDWIYRSLPKYVQKHIDYCDYVDGVYRIHVKTEHGAKEIAERRWVDAGAKVRQFVKNAQ